MNKFCYFFPDFIIFCSDKMPGKQGIICVFHLTNGTRYHTMKTDNGCLDKLNINEEKHLDACIVSRHKKKGDLYDSATEKEQQTACCAGDFAGDRRWPGCRLWRQERQCGRTIDRKVGCPDGCYCPAGNHRSHAGRKGNGPDGSADAAGNHCGCACRKGSCPDGSADAAGNHCRCPCRKGSCPDGS